VTASGTLLLEALKDPDVVAELRRILGPPPSNDPGELIGVAEAARMFGMSRPAIRARCYRGSLPHIRVGKVIRFNRSELLALLEGGRR